MKKLILIAALAVACLSALAPTTSRAQISIEIGDRGYYRGAWYWGPNHHHRMYWVPGHWSVHHHNRVWIHGHYVERYHW